MRRTRKAKATAAVAEEQEEHNNENSNNSVDLSEISAKYIHQVLTDLQRLSDVDECYSQISYEFEQRCHEFKRVMSSLLDSSSVSHQTDSMTSLLNNTSTTSKNNKIKITRVFVEKADGNNEDNVKEGNEMIVDEHHEGISSPARGADRFERLAMRFKTPMESAARVQSKLGFNFDQQSKQHVADPSAICLDFDTAAKKQQLQIKKEKEIIIEKGKSSREITSKKNRKRSAVVAEISMNAGDNETTTADEDREEPPPPVTKSKKGKKKLIKKKKKIPTAGEDDPVATADDDKAVGEEAVVESKKPSSKKLKLQKAAAVDQKEECKTKEKKKETVKAEPSCSTDVKKTATKKLRTKKKKSSIAATKTPATIVTGGTTSGAFSKKRSAAKKPRTEQQQESMANRKRSLTRLNTIVAPTPGRINNLNKSILGRSILLDRTRTTNMNHNNNNNNNKTPHGKTPHMARISRIIQSTIKRSLKKKPLTRAGLRAVSSTKATAAGAFSSKTTTITNSAPTPVKPSKSTANSAQITATATTTTTTATSSLLQKTHESNFKKKLATGTNNFVESGGNGNVSVITGAASPAPSTMSSLQRRIHQKKQRMLLNSDAKIKTIKSAIDDRKMRLTKSRTSEKRKSDRKSKKAAVVLAAEAQALSSSKPSEIISSSSSQESNKNVIDDTFEVKCDPPRDDLKENSLLLVVDSESSNDAAVASDNNSLMPGGGAGSVRTNSSSSQSSLSSEQSKNPKEMISGSPCRSNQQSPTAAKKRHLFKNHKHGKVKETNGTIEWQATTSSSSTTTTTITPTLNPTTTLTSTEEQSQKRKSIQITKSLKVSISSSKEEFAMINECLANPSACVELVDVGAHPPATPKAQKQQQNQPEKNKATHRPYQPAAPLSIKKTHTTQSVSNIPGSMSKQRSQLPVFQSTSKLLGTPMRNNATYSSLANLNSNTASKKDGGGATRLSFVKFLERNTPSKLNRQDIGEKRKQELAQKDTREKQRLEEMKQKRIAEQEEKKRERAEKVRRMAEFKQKQTEEAEQRGRELEQKNREAERRRCEALEAQKEKTKATNNNLNTNNMSTVMNSTAITGSTSGETTTTAAPGGTSTNVQAHMFSSAQKSSKHILHLTKGSSSNNNNNNNNNNANNKHYNESKAQVESILQKTRAQAEQLAAAASLPKLNVQEQEDHQDENCNPNNQGKGAKQQLETTYVLDEMHDEHHHNQQPLSSLSTNLKLPGIKSYDVTPLQPLKLKDKDNYDVSGLQTEDETDDEEEPSKPLPDWAKQPTLNTKAQKQAQMMVNFTKLFRASCQPEVDLKKIFKATKKKFDEPRSSSAVWGSPPVWETDGLNGEESFRQFRRY